MGSVFYFNLDADWDPFAVYFFAHFFTGVMVYQALAEPRYRNLFAAYLLVLAAGLAYDWRGHLAISLVTGSAYTWPAGRAGSSDGPITRWSAFKPARRIACSSCTFRC